MSRLITRFIGVSAISSGPSMIPLALYFGVGVSFILVLFGVVIVAGADVLRDSVHYEGDADGDCEVD
jgi:hypothetical protein